MEKLLNLRQEFTRRIIYEKIENVQAGREAELLADLKDRTGIDIKRFEIYKIDFLRDIAYINIFFAPIGLKKTDSDE